MDNNFKIEEKQLLLVEGKDECNFFKELLKYEEINGVQWVDIGGKDKFPVEFPLLINMEGFNLEGLVLDLQGFFGRLNLMALMYTPTK